jgi:hypothetical protein
MINNLNLEIYEFEIKNYPWQLAVNSKSILPGIDIKTSELFSTGKNCGSINTEIDLTKYTDPMFKNIKTHTTRSCDPIQGKMTVSNTTDKVNLVVEDELMDSFAASTPEDTVFIALPTPSDICCALGTLFLNVSTTLFGACIYI